MDPRVQKELKQIEEERQRVKKENRERKENEKRRIQAVIDKVDKERKDIEDKKLEDVRLRKQALGDDKKRFKVLTKEFINVLEDKVPDSKYDQFFAEEFVKKLANNQELESLIQRAKDWNKNEFIELI